MKGCAQYDNYGSNNLNSKWISGLINNPNDLLFYTKRLLLFVITNLLKGDYFSCWQVDYDYAFNIWFMEMLLL